MWVCVWALNLLLYIVHKSLQQQQKFEINYATIYFEISTIYNIIRWNWNITNYI